MPTNASRTAHHEHRGVRGFIERMFSGFVMDYHDAAEIGRDRVVAVVVTGTASPAATRVTIVRRREDFASFDVDVLSTVAGPRVYPLPNSPTGWEESRHGVRVGYGDMLHDPARPNGLIGDVLGLGTDDKRR